MATNNYRAGGGGNFPGIGEDKWSGGPDTNRDVLVRYIMQQGTVNPTADGNWRFAALPGTTAIFLSGPKGRNFVSASVRRASRRAGEGPGRLYPLSHHCSETMEKGPANTGPFHMRFEASFMA